MQRDNDVSDGHGVQREGWSAQLLVFCAEYFGCVAGAGISYDLGMLSEAIRVKGGSMWLQMMNMACEGGFSCLYSYD
jgi:hypothetical protein